MTVKPLAAALACTFISMGSVAATNIAQFIDSQGNANINTPAPTPYVFNQVDIDSVKITQQGSKFFVEDVGIYRVNYSLSWRTSGVGASARRQIKTYILTNGTDISATSYEYARIENYAENATNQGNFLLELNAGDYIELIHTASSENLNEALSNPGESWIALEFVSTREENGKYPKSCLEIKQNSPASKSGTYTIDPDGTNGEAHFDVYCDMATEGGGWTMISKYSGIGGQCSYPDFNACNLEGMSHAGLSQSAKLNHNAIIALVDGRSDALFRAKSTFDDTVIKRVDGGDPFSTVAVGDKFACRDIAKSNWHNYSIDGLVHYPTRLTTWTTNLTYVGKSDQIIQCGNGITFESERFPALHAIDAGSTSAPTVQGAFYIK
ncbi:fibrinogen-like YCDxxxxGGGW domain-containing protein [Pseudoalteromonas luteoviolacea]|uniref:Fibrinogen C-terminal domain-containing protein n=1 Tax=Pseudoalteromonas luteoviolacea H33 TaxID=1365251 RepID=A0A161Y832_9GAMM|nr:fibrinogen-like YCDxxxxGGGW domain-containing protein [Pseudoalteromonas luteoviolacea]KZN51969.1 hypothetical protein N476_01185 [Pseudoalteromonas luteoviolacea H33]KZN78685.1 hypothetical protein N477_07660 [Pseudoalteromonas luteoviolacea H33-S]MBQ4876048.1 hypothetical protein [Pseudoalteromonas luteoviolacea]MBQ4905683.1 hypothetical protein [Pseudoalteromonas luteoviolacea]